MTHADEARRIVDEFVRDWLKSEQPVGTTQERLAAEIAAALAAAVRAEIERAIAQIATAGAGDCCHETVERSVAAIRALLPAAVAEPAAKCAHAKSYETMLPVRVCQACGARLVTMVQPAAKCATCEGRGYHMNFDTRVSCPACAGGGA